MNLVDMCYYKILTIGSQTIVEKNVSCFLFKLRCDITRCTRSKIKFLTNGMMHVWVTKYNTVYIYNWASSVAQWERIHLPSREDTRHKSSIPRSGRSPGAGRGNPLQFFLLGKSHGQRSLAGLWSRGSQKSQTWLKD